MTVPIERVETRILSIRGHRVMVDTDLAEVYGVPTKALNQAIKRNAERFPEDFMFQLTREEAYVLRSQTVTLKNERGRHRKYLPYVFTEQGIAMLSAVLRSEVAVQVSIQIMQAFVEMRRMLTLNQNLFQRLDRIELKQLETENKMDIIFDALDNRILKPKQGIFFDGQIYDAYSFVSELIKSAKRQIILIDNYVDDTVLTMLSKKNRNYSA
jgi:phage regulator Rha-like protein